MMVPEELLSAALDCADMGGLGMLPSPYRRAFVDELQKAIDGGAELSELTACLAEHRPDEFLVLEEPVHTLLVSPAGLGITEEDLPRDAMEYLSLLVFLRGEMDEGNLPYHNFGEMNRSAADGRTLAQGLVEADRERLVRMRVEPELRRLWPRDPERVRAEVERLLAG